MLHNFSIGESLFTVSSCTGIHVHSKPQSMIACCNIYFVKKYIIIKNEKWQRVCVGGKHF